jgi:hypothetical protein
MVWYPIGRRVVIGRIETREEMKTTTARKGVVTRKEDDARTTGEDKTGEWELMITAEVQVMEVKSCFLSEAWWLLFLPPSLTYKHYFSCTLYLCFLYHHHHHHSKGCQETPSTSWSM